MPLTYFDNDADTLVIVEALRRDGAVVVTNLADPGVVEDVRRELRPQLDAETLSPSTDFDRT